MAQRTHIKEFDGFKIRHTIKVRNVNLVFYKEWAGVSIRQRKNNGPFTFWRRDGDALAITVTFQDADGNIIPEAGAVPESIVGRNRIMW